MKSEQLREWMIHLGANSCGRVSIKPAPLLLLTLAGCASTVERPD